MSLHNDPTQANAYTRRAFLANSTLFASAALTVPAFLQSSAFALPRPELGLSSIPGVDEDTILVVVQLSGGNDGLNTVVPYRDDNYRRSRPDLALPTDQLHILSQYGRNGAGDIGLHPSLTGFRELYDEGLCAVIQGVGYPNPNRSHFASMDIWHTADTSGTGDGWIGRYIDSQCCGYGSGESGKAPETQDNPEPPIALGTEIPLALQGRKIMPVSLESPEMFSWAGTKYAKDLAEHYEKLMNTQPEEGDDSNSAFLTRTAMDAQISSQTIRNAVDQKPLVNYPDSKLAGQLSMVGSMIRAGMKSRVYYASHGSFDTHANQLFSHARLLEQLASAVNAFYKDLKAQGNDQRVVVMCFSEFGRRVSQNASRGTDHGTAAPMFLFGPRVTPGIHGVHPSLSNLDDGDLKYTVDFRSVYAELLDSWMDTKSRDVLGQNYRHLRVLKKA